MKPNYLNILFLVALALFISNCAQIGTLSGGPKDVTPPKLLEALPELKTTNFNSSEIVLRFDEFITLKDLNNQLMVSPKLATKPDIAYNGKKITIKLNPSELLPNTTYRFYFGNAIVDMHESNPLPNFSYIFSTGNTIDTLKIRGTVENALLKSKERDIVVGLYFDKQLTDSFAFKQTPDYLTRTDGTGQFEIENLPSANFKMVCFSDKNKDYLYNGTDIEQVGFIKDSFNPTTDSSFKITLFKEIPSKTFIKKTIMNENGRGMIIFNQETNLKMKPFSEQIAKDLYLLNNGIASDSSEFFYRNQTDSLWLIANYGQANDTHTDTLQLRVPKLKPRNKRILSIKGNISSGKLKYNDSIKLYCSQWIDTSKTRLNGIKLISKTDTSVNSSPLKLSYTSANTILIHRKLKPSASYTLVVDTSSVWGYNSTNNDSTVIPFAFNSKKDLGHLSLKITFNKKQDYIVQLLNESNTVVIERNVSFSLSSSNTATITVQDLEEGSYKVRIIYDDNSDKTWNTGQLIKKIYPEKIIVLEKAVKILPDWDIEEEFILKE